MAGVATLRTGSLALLLLATACGAVDVRRTEVSGADRTACAALVDAVPDTVADAARRETKGSPLGAAWGDPAIVLRCGVGKPAGYDPFAGCQTVEGIDWFVPLDQVEDQDREVVLTTLGRQPAVEVVVPSERRPPDAVMVDVAAVVKRHTRLIERCE